MAVLELNVVSDFVCPWCFLGSKRLEQAICELRGASAGRALEVHVRWWPHFLMPHLKRKSLDSVDKRTMYAKRFAGSREKVSAMEASFNDALRPFGESYTADGQVSSTLAAHRLSEWTARNKSEAAQWALVNELFRAYHSRAEGLAELEVIRGAATRAGIFTAQELDEWLGEFLSSTELEGEVLALADGGNRANLGLDMLAGVPHIKAQVVGGLSFEIPGAQDVDYFVRMLSRMIEKSRL